MRQLLTRLWDRLCSLGAVSHKEEVYVRNGKVKYRLNDETVYFGLISKAPTYIQKKAKVIVSEPDWVEKFAKEMAEEFNKPEWD